MLVIISKGLGSLIGLKKTTNYYSKKDNCCNQYYCLFKNVDWRFNYNSVFWTVKFIKRFKNTNKSYFTCG